MTKLEIILDFENICEKYVVAEKALKELKRERLKIKSELLKVNNLLIKADSQKEKKLLKKDEQSLKERKQEICEYMATINQEMNEMLESMQSYYKILFNVFDATIYPDEITRILKERTGKKWSFQNIYHYNGAVVGVALVSDKSEHFGEKINAHVSINENKIFLENDDEMKVVFSAVSEDSDGIFSKWNWTKFYLYATSAFYDNEKMKTKYHDFLTRDFDFAELICYGIRDELISDVEMVNHEQ